MQSENVNAPGGPQNNPQINNPGDNNAQNQNLGGQQPVQAVGGVQAQAAPAVGAGQAPIANAAQPSSEFEVKRAEVYPLSDRFQVEKGILAQPMVGGGLFGFSSVDLSQLKKLKLQDVPQDYKFESNDKIMEKLENDGIYVLDPEVQNKYKDINVQKLEERLLQNNNTRFFKANGDLKLDNDLLADEMTRPADMSFEKTMAFQTKETNAILQDRHHSYKKRYYRLDVIVGKLKVSRCKSIFSEEDTLAQDLKRQFKDYETRVSLAMIPFYEQRLKFIEDEIHEKQKPGSKKTELTFLQSNKIEVAQKLFEERELIQTMTTTMYDTWKRIEEVRETQGFKGANVQFLVYQNELDNGKVEYRFNLTNEQLPAKKKNGQDLDSTEVKRRKDAEKQKFYVRLLINGKRVASSQKCYMKHPNYEVAVDEVFQINTFTMPKSLEMEVVLAGFSGCCDTLVDRVEIEVPGEHVRTLTCASQLIQVKPFSHFEYDQRTRKQSNPIDPEMGKDANNKALLEAQKKAEDALVEKRRKTDIAGEMFVKAEWKGNGPMMPPIKSENLFAKAQPPKNRLIYDEVEMAKNLYIDVNDPRNQKVMKDLKFLGNKYLCAMMEEDTKNDLHKIKPFRHVLLKQRARNPILQKLFIPLLENEIVDSNRTGVYLEQLEKIYQEEAYNQHLIKKAQLQKQHAQQVLGLDPTQPLERDFDTMRRRNEILTKIKNRRKSQALAAAQTQTYNQVVREYDLPAFEENPIKALLQKLLVARSRKLKPVAKAPDPVSFNNLTEFNINFHIIKAENVPLRHDFLREFNNKAGQGNRQRGGAGSMRQPYYGAQNNQGGGGGNYGPGAGSYGQQPQPSYGPGPTNDDRDKQLIADMWQTSRVEPYVEVKIVFDDKKFLVKRTTVDEGQLPKWDQVLSFIYKEPSGHKFTQKQLEKSSTKVVVSLFDKQIYRHQEEGKIILQEENRFLGSFEIPFISLLTGNGKMEFNFKFNRPFILPSYRVLAEQFYFASSNPANLQDEALRRNEQIPTYVSMSITLDPPIGLPDENVECDYRGYETPELLAEGTSWSNALRTASKYKGRRFAVFGESIDAESVLLCKYLTPIRPPTHVVDLESGNQDELDYAIEKVARFVSLIPFVEDSRKFEDLTDMYCTPQEFLDIGEGDYEEHAILLCNYFKYIDDKRKQDIVIENYLVYGEAVPEGRTVYVLRKQKDEHSVEIWCPLTGECYFFKLNKGAPTCCGIGGGRPYLSFRTNDPICPLRKVWNIVGDQNIYANIQRFDFPVQMSFDFSKTGDWKPLFEPKTRDNFFKAGVIEPCYDPSLKYTNPSEIGQTSILGERVQKYLNDQFEEERIKTVRKPTKWAVMQVEKFRLLLVEFEFFIKRARKGGHNDRLRMRQHTDEDLKINELSKSLATIDKNVDKRVWGFPINVSLTTFENLWDAVKATRMHQVNRQDVEFVLAVHIAAYPCGVMSVWVYVVALVDKTTENLSVE